ncbi:MAG: hypothetical protein UX09_C0029G0015 [Candidatus Uhrbacteria bacterium GW2011_GWE2_45_35]|uniref:Uncharacterized protein n=1 Tax=Candidatus Uhrbacteria bacterium GW2011_GWE2_45_35 TaxID=1618993 RepID=A0A0G1MGL5_9BACT|nr:MAG: hypothetical protein UX09_C0029G0015 [Candidatus Uhrbacteria bacterium GW2011_GWE2_45_35]
MPAGGPSLEQERKAVLDKALAAARRQSSVTQKIRRGLEETKKKYEQKSMSNIVKTSLSASQIGRMPILGERLGKITGGIQQQLLDDKEPESAQQKSDQNQQPEKPSEENQQQPEQENTQQQVTQNQMQTRQAQLQASQQQQRIRQQSLDQIKEAALDKVREKTQKKVRKQLQNFVRRGTEELLQVIGGAVDTGTAGFSTIVTIFVYAFTLTDLNLQMIWGHYIKKGKSFLFPALDDWDPLPISTRLMPIWVLHTIIILIDICVVLCLLILFTSMLILMFGPSLGLASVIYLTLFDNNFRSAAADFITQIF